MLARGQAVLVGLFCAAACPAQLDLPRETVFGLARTAAGEPWAGAEVHLLARPLPHHHTLGTADHVVATTDARGRFRTEIVAGRSYTVWAREDRGEGEVAFSDFVEGVSPRTPVVLDEHAVRSPSELTLAGLDAFRGRGPFRVEVLFGSDIVTELGGGNVGHVVTRTAPGADCFELPPLPGHQCVVEVLDASGFPLLSVPESLPLREAFTLTVPEPETVRFAVRAFDTGKAIAGARIRYASRGRLFDVGRTQPDGTLETDLPRELIRQQFFAFATGRAPAELREGPEPLAAPRGWPPLREGFVADRYAFVGAGCTLRGRVLIAASAPADDLPLLVEARAVHRDERGSMRIVPYVDVVCTDADGRFVVPSLTAEAPVALHALLEPRHVRRFPEAVRDGLCPLVSGLAIVSRPGHGKADLGGLDLSRSAVVRLRLLHEDGTPAAGTSLRVAHRGAYQLVRRPTQRTDRNGCVVLLVPQDAHPIVIARDAAAIAVFGIETAETASSAAPVELEVPLGGGRRVAGRLIDQHGVPVAGVEVSAILRNAQALRPLVETPPVERVEGARITGVERLAEATMMLRHEALSTRTDEEGRFAFTMPRVYATWLLHGRGFRHEVSVANDPIEPCTVRVVR